jgi:hypothetical protein
MAGIYSRLLAYEPHSSGDSAALSPPASSIWVLRDIVIWNGNELESVAASVTGIGGTVIYSVGWAVGGGYAHEEGRWVIPADGWIQMHATFPCDFYLSGYELTQL